MTVISVGGKNSGPCLLLLFLLLLLLLLLTKPTSNFWLLSLPPILQVEIVASVEQAMHSVASRPFCKMFLQPRMIWLHHSCFPDPSTRHLFPVLSDPLQLEPPLLLTWLTLFLHLQLNTHQMYVRVPALRTWAASFLRTGTVSDLFMTHQCCHGAALNTKKKCLWKESKKKGK